MLVESLTCCQSWSSGLSLGGGGVGGLLSTKSLFAKSALSPAAKGLCIVPDSPFLSTTLMSCSPGGTEKVPRRPMAPTDFPSRYTCAPRLQPRIVMLAGLLNGGRVVGGLVAGGGVVVDVEAVPVVEGG